MIKINIKTANTIKVKSFEKKYDLVNYCISEFCWLVSDDYSSFIDDAQKLANKIWNTNVGQSFKSDLGHIISIAGKSFDHNSMLGDK